MPAGARLFLDYCAACHFVDGRGGSEIFPPLDGNPIDAVWQERPAALLVLKDGAPVPFAEVEVEFVNDGTVVPPNDDFITQVLKADANGTFSYVMPRAGWWGFAALLDGDTPGKAPDGKEVPVEEGALIWVKATDMGGN